MAASETVTVTSIDGCRLFVAMDGRAGPQPDLVLLHSLGADHRVFDGVAPALAADRRVIRPDARGHGRSPCGDITLARQVDDLLAVMDALGVARAVVVGLSMGGVEALALWERAPERVAALILMDTFSTLGPETARRWIADKQADLARWPMAEVARRYVDATLTATAPAWARRALAEAVAGMSAANYEAATRACFEADLDHVLATVRVPTLVLVGEVDRRTPLDPYARRLAEGIPGARLETVPAAGHLAPMDNPEAVAERIARFLRQLA